MYTMLFTDVEGSTRLLHQVGPEYPQLLSDHNRFLRAAFVRHGGVEVATQGDSFFTVFDQPGDAIAAISEAQRAMAEHQWPSGVRVRVRAGLHLGEAVVSDDDLVGLDVHRAARIASAAHGGQVLLSDTLVRALPPGSAAVRNLGRHELKDLPKPEHLFQLDLPGLETEFPPPRTQEPGPAAAEAALAHERRRHRRRIGVLSTALLVAITTAVVLAITFEQSEDRPAPPGAGELLVLDRRSGDVRSSVTIGGTPQSLAAAGGRVWVVDADEQTLAQVDPEAGSVATFATGSTPTDVAAGQAGVWVGEGRVTARAQHAGPIPLGIARVDPRTRTVHARVAFPRTGDLAARSADDLIAVERDAVWAVSGSGAIVRIDPRTNEVVTTIRGIDAFAVAAGDGGVWALGETGEVAWIDRTRNRIGRRTRIDASNVDSIVVEGGAAWVSAPADGRIWRLTRGPRIDRRPIAAGAGVTDLAVGGGAVWAVNPLRGEVLRIAAGGESATRFTAPGGLPRGIAVDRDAVFVAVAQPEEGIAPVASETSGGVALASCGRVLARVRAPERLLIADLPLQGGIRLSAQQVSQAIAYVLRRRGFQAGGVDLGLQVCDHSIARTGIFDETKCAANVRAFGRVRRVIGVIGPINTPCALASLPEANRAGLAVISPAASAPELTRGSQDLYPSGRRNFARVYPPDDRQWAALADFARAVGVRRVAVVHDGDENYGKQTAAAFTRRARAVGLATTSPRQWRQHARSYAALARAIARERPDAVFLGGLLDTGGARVLVALRARLGQDTPLLVPDGFTPTPLLVRQAGAAAARGTYLSVNGSCATPCHQPGGASYAPSARHSQASRLSRQPYMRPPPPKSCSTQSQLRAAVAMVSGVRC